MNYISDAIELLNEIDRTVNLNKGAPKTSRTICATALYACSLDHSRAVCELINIGICSSASALQRVNFEHYIRGAWIHHCATNDQINILIADDVIKKISIDKNEIKFYKLIADIENKINTESFLSSLKKNLWKSLNSYTHGGMHQISRYIKGNEIYQNFSEAEKYEIIEFALIIACFSFSGILDLYKISDADKITDHLIDRTIKWKSLYRPILHP